MLGPWPDPDGFQSTYKRAPLRKAKTLLGAAGSLTGGLRGLSKRVTGGEEAVSDAQSAVGGAKGAVDTVQTDELREAKDGAFNEAIVEARPHFAKCPSCAKYVDARCWNQQALKCIECAPRQALEKAKAQAQVTETEEVAMAKEVSPETTEAEEVTVICSNCGKPTPMEKFCETCGAPLDRKLCPKCGAKNSVSARFCNNCGNKLL